MPPRNKVNIARVRQLLAQGLDNQAIARRLGISDQVVSQIKHDRYPTKEKPASR